MREAIFDQSMPALEFDELPITLVQRTSRASSLLKIMLLSPALAVLCAPILLFAVRAAAEPTALAIISDRPLAAGQILIGLAIWVALFVVPLKRVLGRMGAERRVEIDRALVRVVDTGFFRRRTWVEPLASYRGIAHHVRASMSGLRHELLLVHPDPAKTVLVALADRIPQSTIDRAKALFQLPEVPAKDLYARSSERRGEAMISPGLVVARA